MDVKESEIVDSEMPAVTEMQEGSSDSSDSDNSDDDSEDMAEGIPSEKQEVFPEEVDEIPAPFDYNGHIERIKRLRAKGDVSVLRQARESMNKNFPLSPQLWLDWIEDERQCNENTPEGRAVIVDLFDRAVQDYLSVELWVEYVQFTIGYMADVDGSIEKVRTIFERALMAAGLHVPKGALVWEAYREFEIIILSSMASNCSGENAELAEQLKRVANLFKRQLSVPLPNMEKAYSSFEEWLEQHKTVWTTASGKPESSLIDKNNLELSFKKALDRLHRIQPYEDVLVSCLESDKVTHYKEYLKFEQSLGEPVRLLCLFERALSDCPLDAPLWLGYIEFSDGMSAGEKTVQLCQRSIRNCPWYSLLWQQYIRSMEKCSRSHIEIKGVLEEALRAGMQAAEDYRNLWIEYVSYFRRRIDWGSQKEGPLLQEFRETVRTACEHLEQNFGDEGDPSCQLLRLIATVDAVQSRKIDEARKTWNEILSKGHKTSAASWVHYIHLEMAYGDSKHLRKLFPRALQSTRDWPESIVEEWLHFERVEGTLDSYEDALYKCRSRLKQVAIEREKAAAEEVPHQQKPGLGKTQAVKGMKSRDKKGKLETVTEDRRVSSLKRPSPTENDFQIKTTDSLSDAKNKNKVKRPKLSDSPSDPSKDDRTIFLSNLHRTVDEDQITEVFSSVGTISEVRLVKNFNGTSRGFGFVEFSSYEEASEALKKDRELIDGRPVFVSKCNPDKESRQHAFKFSKKLEKNKLFVKGLPISTTQEDLQTLFGQYGTLKAIRMPTHRTGSFKRLAYVEFEDEASAAHALIKVDGMMMGDNIISVAISQPPDRRTSLLPKSNDPSTSFIQSLGGSAKGDEPSTSFIRSLGGSAKVVGARGRGRTQLAFLPRSLQVKQEGSNDSEKTTSNSNGKSESKSNADFRKLLLGDK